MTRRKTGPILTDTKKDVIKGNYRNGPDPPTRQAEKDHRDAIEENLSGALFDLRWLFRHADQTDLNEIFGQGYDSLAGPVRRVEHTRPPIDGLKKQLDGKGKPDKSNDGSTENDLSIRRPFGWTSTEDANELVTHVDEQGRVVPKDQYPDTQTKLEQITDRLLGSNKSSPETQEALIESVAFICRAAEGGELDVDQLIAHGVERYYQNSPTKDGYMVTLEKWSEEEYGEALKQKHERATHTKDTTPAPTQAEIRYLEREGYDISPEEEEGEKFFDKSVKDNNSDRLSD